MDAYSSIHEGVRKGHAAGDSDVEKQPQLKLFDVRYSKGKVKPGASKEQMVKVYMSVLASSPAPATVKTMPKKKLLGEAPWTSRDLRFLSPNVSLLQRESKIRPRRKYEGVRDEDPEEH